MSAVIWKMDRIGIQDEDDAEHQIRLHKHIISSAKMDFECSTNLIWICR